MNNKLYIITGLFLSTILLFFVITSFSGSSNESSLMNTESSIDNITINTVENLQEDDGFLNFKEVNRLSILPKMTIDQEDDDVSTTPNNDMASEEPREINEVGQDKVVTSQEVSQTLDSHENIDVNIGGPFGGVVLSTTNCNCWPTGRDRTFGQDGLPVDYGTLITVGDPRGGTFMVLKSDIFGLLRVSLTEIYEHERIEPGHWVLGTSNIFTSNIQTPSFSNPLSLSCYRKSTIGTIVGALRRIITIVIGGQEQTVQLSEDVNVIRCSSSAEGSGPFVEKIGTSNIPAGAGL